jgi:hypothetical protein
MLASIAVALWQFELLRRIGWPGLRWLDHPSWSVHVIYLLFACALAVGAGAPAPRAWSWWRRVAFFAAIYLLSSLCLDMVKVGVAQLFFVGYATWLDPIQAIPGLSHALLPLGGLLLALGTSTAVHLLHAPLRRFRCGFFMLVALVAVGPASFLTVLVFPAHDGSTNFIHAIKMGYPAFWVIVLSSAAVAASRRPNTAPQAQLDRG